ncbi:MAG: hypothetical protein EP343_21580 [Deltaproteobacteria bacterium]|nr:MAG: hypothetical protein EP343_21580 [Deltaproteobacteria bacterium]
MTQPPSFEQVWEELPSHLPAPELPVGMDDRFWERFDAELGPLEQVRQERASRRSFWSSLFQLRWIGAMGGAVAAALLLVVWMNPWTSQPSTHPLAKAAKVRGSQLQQGSLPKAHPEAVPSKVALQPAQRSSLPSQEPHRDVVEDLSFYKNMEVLEKMQLLEKLPSLTKGS